MRPLEYAVPVRRGAIYRLGVGFLSSILGIGGGPPDGGALGRSYRRRATRRSHLAPTPRRVIQWLLAVALVAARLAPPGWSLTDLRRDRIFGFSFAYSGALSTSDVIAFKLSDGTSVMVRDSDLRRIYEALWDLSDLPGAVSTAAMLMHEGNQSARFRHPIELNVAQGEVLRQAVARFVNPS